MYATQQPEGRAWIGGDISVAIPGSLFVSTKRLGGFWEAGEGRSQLGGVLAITLRPIAVCDHPLE